MTAMAPPTTGVDSISLSSSSSLLNVNMTNVTKLSATNYLMWHRQVYALLDGYELASYLDSSSPPPPATVTVADTTTVNPDYKRWKRQDRLIYSALLGAISVSIQPILSRTQTAADVWEKLAATFAKPSRGNVKELKLQLKQWTKGTKTVDEYFQGLTMRFDQLALLGKLIDHEDQVEFVLDGLPEDYKDIVNQLEGRDTPPTLEELHEKLLNQEAKLLSVPKSESFPFTANVVTNNAYRPQQRNNTCSPQTWNTNQP